MNEADARVVLLVKAIETADLDGQLLTPAQRQGASDIVRAALPSPGRSLKQRDWSERFLVKRAERLLQEAAARRSSIQTIVEPARAWAVVRSLLLLLSFAVGAMSDALVNPGRINLLSIPLLGIVLWNWAMLALWLGAKLLHLRRRSPGVPYAFVSSLIAWPARWRRGGFAVASQFSRAWVQAGAPLLLARVKAALHLGAAAMALGMIAYVLAKALPNEFSVGWESQLLKTPGEVHAFLRVLFLPLAPLSELTGVAPFTLDEIARMHRWSESSPELADRWLRLVTALLGVSVILPRLALGFLQSRRARRLARDFPIDLTDPYFGRLLSTGAGMQYRLVVWPYSISVDTERSAALVRQAAELLGPGTVVEVQAATRYGGSVDALAHKATAAAPGGQVVETAGLFNLSATPEAETHGAFLKRLAQASGRNAMVLLDSSVFVGKLGEGDRLRERVNLWTDFLQQHGMTRVHVMNLGA